MSYTVQAAEPNASATVRGVLTPGAQTIGGDKILQGSLEVQGAGKSLWVSSNEGVYLNAGGFKRIYFDGSVMAANGDFKAYGILSATGEIQFANATVGILRGGAGFIRIDDSVGVQLLYGNNTLTMDSVNAAWNLPAGKFSITGDTTSPAKAAFQLVPQDTQPTGPNAVGDMYVTTAGVLKICTVAGSPGTWVSVGAQ